MDMDWMLGAGLFATTVMAGMAVHILAGECG